MKKLLCVVAIVVSSACTHNMPPNLTPAAQSAFKNTQVIKGLDLIRDTATDANAQTPPVLSTATTLKVVNIHESLIKVIHDSPDGWKAQVQAGLTELNNNLSPTEQTLLGPYITLLQSIIKGVLQ